MRHQPQPLAFLCAALVVGVVNFAMSTTFARPVDQTEQPTPTQTILPAKDMPVITARNVNRLTELAILPGTSYWIKGVSFSPDGKLLVAVQDGTGVFLWDTTTWKPVTLLRFQPEDFLSSNAVFSPNGKYLVAANGIEHPAIYIWDIQTAINQVASQPLRKIPISNPSVVNIAFHPTGKHFATITEDGEISTWDIATGQELERLATDNPAARDLEFSPDGKLLGYTSLKGVRIINMNPRKQITILDSVRSDIAFSPDGLLLAFGMDETNGIIRLWDVQQNREIFVPKEPTGAAGIVFSPDGKLLAAGSSTGVALILWDVSTGRELRAMEVGGINAITFSPDGKYIVTGHAGSGLGNIGVTVWGIR